MDLELLFIFMVHCYNNIAMIWLSEIRSPFRFDLCNIEVLTIMPHPLKLSLINVLNEKATDLHSTISFERFAKSTYYFPF
jgi:hypothetical protein